VKSLGRCRISGRKGDFSTMKYHYSWRLFAYRRASFTINWLSGWTRQIQIGSSAGAAHLLKDNVDVLWLTQCGQKPHVEHKGKCQLDFTFQYEDKQWKLGLAILCAHRVCEHRCQKSYHRDNWLVAAKRSQRRCILILRCRLFLPLCCIWHKASDCSPSNRERELGLDRRETG
jgi:hypothetical protein